MGATRLAGKMQCSYTNKGSQTALITRLMCLRLSARRGTRRSKFAAVKRRSR